ncbi:MAG: MFS transporter [Novosphingobium sp.]|nr:MFS transporter [Novosphingobium sp.]
MNVAQGAMTARDEWKTGWTVVFAGFMGMFFFSVLFGSMSVFMGPLTEEFGWSRTLVSAGMSISSVFTAILSPFFGILIDKFGSRKVALPGVIVTAVATAAIGLASGSSAQWLLLWSVYAVVSLSAGTTVWTAAVAGVFDKAQGLAIGFALAGATAAHAVMPPLANYLIDTIGWRMAFAWLGLGWGAVAFVITWFLFYDVHDGRGVGTRGVKRESTGNAQFPGLTISEAWKSRALWSIGISIIIIMMMSIGLFFHQIEILIGTGVDRTNAAWLASLAGGMGIVGKLITGILLDRYRGSLVGGITMSTTAIAFALLIYGTQSTALLVVAMMVNGYTAGAKLQIGSYLTVRYCGMKNFGKIYGFMSSLVGIGSGLGPIVAGMIFDMSGNYTAFLIAGAVGMLLSSMLLITLPRYPQWRREEEPVGEPALA